MKARPDVTAELLRQLYWEEGLSERRIADRLGMRRPTLHEAMIRLGVPRRDQLAHCNRPTCSIDGCDEPHEARGFCRLHYKRLRRYGDPLADPDRPWTGQSRAERFWSQVDTSAGPLECWLWTGALRSDGYARFWDGDRQVYVHRWAYEDRVGPVPEGMELDHVAARGCRHRHCVNPAHLEPVTHQENTVRAIVKPTCKWGHEYTPDNTYVDTRGRRACRICKRERASADRSAVA